MDSGGVSVSGLVELGSLGRLAVVGSLGERALVGGLVGLVRVSVWLVV